jgi:hypothetical protein
MSRNGNPRGKRPDPQGFGRIPIPKKESLAFTGFGIDPRKVGAGSNASPH